MKQRTEQGQRSRGRAARLAQRIRRGESVPAPLGLALEAATVFMRAGMWLRRRQPEVRVDAQVVSFGNVTAGGTGKTPAVIARAREELAAGRRVAVLTRGYGSQPAKAPVAIDTGDCPDLLYDAFGDEPALMARKARGIVIVKCVDRVAAAQMAIEEYGCEVLLLDDGFQQLRLARDENILLVDASNPFGNGHLLPRGILREPVTSARRATSIILTRCDQAEDVAGVQAALAALCPGVEMRLTRHAPAGLWRVADGAEVGFEEIGDREVRAVCAIGNPDAFFQTLRDAGLSVRDCEAWPDHHSIPSGAFGGGNVIITTEKDAMRLRDAPRNVLALSIELEDMG